MNQPAKRNERGYRIGESHHRAKLTDREVELIRELAAEGLTGEQLAAKFDISPGHVSRLLAYRQR